MLAQTLSSINMSLLANTINMGTLNPWLNTQILHA